MVYGYCTDQIDGTSFIGGVFDASATSYPYSEGLAIGGTSGNLLWKGAKVATVNDLPTKTSQLTNDSGFKTTDNNTTYSFATGDNNGQIKVTPSNGSSQNISVKGLGSAAYTDSSAYAPAFIASTTDIVAGSTSLTSGVIYVVYE